VYFTKILITSAITIISLFTISGCQSAMSTTHKNEKYTVVKNEWPLRFEKHSFSARCYETVGCKVLYNDFYHVKKEENEISPAPENDQYQDSWTKMPYGGIENFPPAAVVSWRSKDGVSHEEKVDIANIFKDQKVLHNVKEEEIPEGAKIPSPDIILVVNDRTINVYMRAYIPLKEPRIPGNKYSTHANELVLAYSQTY
jgi:hypothetical protein